MIAIIFDTEQDALDRSAQEATSKGCSHSTQYWWPVSESTDGKWCCWVGSDEVGDGDVTGDKEEAPSVLNGKL